MRYDIVALFNCIDDFCKVLKKSGANSMISQGHSRDRSTNLSIAEMLTIMIMYHFSPCKNFKYFYTGYIPYVYKKEFPRLLSYSRFIQLMPRLFMPLSVLLHCLLGEKTGVYIADSTTLTVCHNKRIRRHKVFKKLCSRGKTTMGWFYGFKLHMVINNKRQIVAVKISTGSLDDRKTIESMTKDLKGKIYADRGYIGRNLFNRLYRKGLKLITGIKRNMKNHLMDLIEKLMLRKRFIIETIFGQLKTDMNLTHTRSRSPTNFFVNVLSCLVAYQTKTIGFKHLHNTLIQN